MFIVILVICLSIAAARRGYRQILPRGAKLLPYVGSSVDAGTVLSPNGTTYLVRYNDAGGMHSGNHWTWVVEYHILTGYSVVSAGYLDIEQANNFSKLDIDWDNEVPVVPFRAGRYE